MYKTLWATVILLFAVCSIGVTADNDPKKRRGSPKLKPTISVVGADIRNNGYTIEIRNNSSTTSGPLTVQTSKGTHDKPSSATAGGIAVQSLGAGASTHVTIDQPPGWNTGYTVFTVEIKEQVRGNSVVDKRSFNIPRP